jgi:hypothetical protein
VLFANETFGVATKKTNFSYYSFGWRLRKVVGKAADRMLGCGEVSVDDSVEFC